MASAISYEFYTAVKGNADGIASLDASGKIPEGQLWIETYKGKYSILSHLQTAYPTGLLGDYAYIISYSSYWYWNVALDTPAWVNQEISATAYDALSTAEKAAVPYIIV